MITQEKIAEDVNNDCSACNEHQIARVSEFCPKHEQEQKEDRDHAIYAHPSDADWEYPYSESTSLDRELT